MSGFRSGVPYARQGTATALAAQPDDNTLNNLFRRYTAGRTTHVRIENKGAVPLRVFFEKPPLDLAGERYFEIAATTGVIDQPMEVTDIWIAGVGGTSAYQLLISERVG